MIYVDSWDVAMFNTEKEWDELANRAACHGGFGPHEPRCPHSHMLEPGDVLKTKLRVQDYNSTTITKIAILDGVSNGKAKYYLTWLPVTNAMVAAINASSIAAT